MLTDRSIDASVQVLHQLMAFEQRLLEHGLVKLPRSVFIGVGQRGEREIMMPSASAAALTAGRRAQRSGTVLLHGH